MAFLYKAYGSTNKYAISKCSLLYEKATIPKISPKNKQTKKSSK